MSEHQKFGWGFILEEAQKWATRLIFAAVALALAYLFTPLKDRLSGIWEGPERLAEISAKLDALSLDVRRATGEDRIIREVPGLSYVTEPVHFGDTLTLNLVIRRTELGERCTLIKRTALFTDETNIASPGPSVSPAMQISTADTAIRLRLQMPAQIRPGRVTVHLSLEYECDGKRMFDQTSPVAFMLLRPK